MFVLTLLLSSIRVGYAWFPSFYPPYCTKDVSTRAIPPLTSEEQAQVDSLVQLQVVIRHGARTPYAEHSCWKDYDVVWNNCNVTEFMLASPSMTSEERPATWLFRKLYDASPNYLGGNCMTGQLISEGYTQANTVGTYLYSAYLNNPISSLNLFNTSVWTDIDTDQYVYLRSDDEQRTLMSGQIVMHGMFNVSEEVIVPWHTGDYNLDQIYTNYEVCPKLTTISDNAYASPEFVKENTSSEVKQLTSDLNGIFGKGYWTWDNVLDCLMTTVCTGNQVPDGMTEEIFNATIIQSEYTSAYLNLYNNSQFSKLAMGNTAWHIRNNLQALLDNQSYALKFAFFGGHDITLTPLLAAILGSTWDGVWPGYLATMSFEVYNATAGGFLFRMVYNGEVMLVPGCLTGLCDLDVLLEALAFGSEDPPCSTTETDAEGCTDSTSNGTDRLENGDVVLIAFMSALFGGLIGAGVVVFVEKHGALGKGKKAALLGGENLNPMTGDANL